MKREEILEALRIVEEECKQRRICDGCRFNEGFDASCKRKCRIANYPEKWNLENKEEPK